MMAVCALCGHQEPRDEVAWTPLVVTVGADRVAGGICTTCQSRMERPDWAIAALAFAGARQRIQRAIRTERMVPHG